MCTTMKMAAPVRVEKSHHTPVSNFLLGSNSTCQGMVTMYELVSPLAGVQPLMVAQREGFDLTSTLGEGMTLHLLPGTTWDSLRSTCTAAGRGRLIGLCSANKRSSVASKIHLVIEELHLGLEVGGLSGAGSQGNRMSREVCRL